MSKTSVCGPHKSVPYVCGMREKKSLSMAVLIQFRQTVFSKISLSFKQKSKLAALQYIKVPGYTKYSRVFFYYIFPGTTLNITKNMSRLPS